MPERCQSTDVEYHLGRARVERDVAYRSGDGIAADAHMRLSELHLQRALLLQAVRTGPVGNVHPFKEPSAGRGSSLPMPALELQSSR